MLRDAFVDGARVVSEGDCNRGTYRPRFPNLHNLYPEENVTGTYLEQYLI